ncbi:MAG: delta-60 repeat domain-containing protein [Flavobacteriales bacterium]|nr:delta-60 repeat domain-containing protein [Flavobacteriales bacterium]
MHNLDDTARGFVGLYNLIWFTNTGHLDTTKTHRKGNGAIYEIEQQPDGKFLCSGTGTVYDGQPVRKVFRVHPDGTLDTSFDSGITWGDANAFLPLADGRAYMVGISRREGFPDDTLRIVRHPMVHWIPASTISMRSVSGELENAWLRCHHPQRTPVGYGCHPAYRRFQFVNGAVRRGICVLDTTGQLRPEFDGAGVSTFVYQNTIKGVVAGLSSPLTTRRLRRLPRLHGRHHQRSGSALHHPVVRAGPDHGGF